MRNSLCICENNGTHPRHIWATSWENQQSAYAKTKTQISFAVTAKLNSAFVFATWIVQSLYFLNTKFQASSHLQWLYSLIYVRPGQNPHCWFPHVAAHFLYMRKQWNTPEAQISCTIPKQKSILGVFNLYLSTTLNLWIAAYPVYIKGQLFKINVSLEFKTLILRLLLFFVGKKWSQKIP